MCVCYDRCHGEHPGLCTYKRVGVQENAFAVLSQRPTVNLGEGDAELGTSQGGQAQTVPAVHAVHCDDLVEDAAEDVPDERGPSRWLISHTTTPRAAKNRMGTRRSPGLFGHVWRHHDDEAARGPVAPQALRHHHSSHAVTGGGDQSDEGFTDGWGSRVSICPT